MLSLHHNVLLIYPAVNTNVPGLCEIYLLFGREPTVLLKHTQDDIQWYCFDLGLPAKLGWIGGVQLALQHVLGDLVNVIDNKVPHLPIPHLSVTANNHELGKEGLDRFIFALFY